MSRDRCRYLTAPKESYVFDPATGKTTETTDPMNYCLCAWGAESDASIIKLDGAPPWLQRLAAAGHMWKLGDCEVCPSYVEQQKAEPEGEG